MARPACETAHSDSGKFQSARQESPTLALIDLASRFACASCFGVPFAHSPKQFDIPQRGVHADFNAITLSHDFTLGGNRYEDDLRLRDLNGDFFPWANSGFRVTTGVRITDNELSGNSISTNGV
ncbi:hypothetical protein FVF58_27350 [Paraburkholderia panacisoli]|uniref:Uncharacterized protein n=1 Tax=Paraburkholderia panacisoli TaxID=2603818 RepID=A0A5B0GTX6_9BURK|nr:hypothetical protein [Paraburkholderia panacisoli]KAA1006292.1 hypothetical protein FVF58_27350 [Paraburkholderia panacisoli]